MSASSAWEDPRVPRGLSPVTREVPLRAPEAQRNLSIGFAASVYLHAVPVLAWLWLSGREPPAPPQKNVLTVDLFGLVSNRLVEQRVRGDDAPEAPPLAAPAPKRPTRRPQEARPKTPPTPPQRAGETTSPVSVPSTAPSPASEGQQAVAASHEDRSSSETGGPSSGPGSHENDQVARRLEAQAAFEASVRAKYLGALLRRINAHMVYPADARLAGHAGTPTVRFSVAASGQIVPGSLVIARSSGHPSIDKAGIRAVIESAPFPPPPRDGTSITATLSFEREEPP